MLTTRHPMNDDFLLTSGHEVSIRLVYYAIEFLTSEGSKANCSCGKYVFIQKRKITAAKQRCMYVQEICVLTDNHMCSV